MLFSKSPLRVIWECNKAAKRAREQYARTMAAIAFKRMDAELKFWADVQQGKSFPVGSLGEVSKGFEE